MNLPPKQFIYYDPERIDYSVSPEELKQLCHGVNNSWKEFCLVAVSLAIPTLVNAIVDIKGQARFSLTLQMFLNTLVAAIAIGAAIVFGVLWYRTRGTIQSVEDAIKNKPKMVIMPSVEHVGELQLKDTSHGSTEKAKSSNS